MSDVRIEYDAERDQLFASDDENESRLEAVRARAYELFESRGKIEGNEVEDWLQAERDVMALEAIAITDEASEDRLEAAPALPTAVFAEPVARISRHSVRPVHSPKYAMNESVTPLAAAKAGTPELRL